MADPKLTEEMDRTYRGLTALVRSTPSNNRGPAPIDIFEWERLKSCDATWQAVFELIMRRNGEAISLAKGSGRDCVLREINRLYDIVDKAK